MRALTLHEFMFSREKDACVDAVCPSESQRRHDAMSAAEHAPMVQVRMFGVLDGHSGAVVAVRTGEEIRHLVDDKDRHMERGAEQLELASHGQQLLCAGREIHGVVSSDLLGAEQRRHGVQHDQLDVAALQAQTQRGTVKHTRQLARSLDKAAMNEADEAMSEQFEPRRAQAEM